MIARVARAVPACRAATGICSFYLRQLSSSDVPVTMDAANAMKAKRWTETVTPWHARPGLVPNEESGSKEVKGLIGQLASTPADLLKRKARIFRRGRAASTSSSHKTKAWKVEFDHQRKCCYTNPPDNSLFTHHLS